MRWFVKLASKFWLELQSIDESIANKILASCCCQHCGGSLYRADFGRKVRGVDASTESDHRVSFKCVKCNKRLTPPSVRFLWRKVYALCAIALYYEPQGFIPSQNKKTIGRWRAYWDIVLSQDSPLMTIIRGTLSVGFDHTLELLILEFSQGGNDAALYFSRAIFLLGSKESLMGYFNRHRMTWDKSD